jgi:hypothetical protein
MSSEAKTVPMNLVIQPNAANAFPTYEWQPRGGCSAGIGCREGSGWRCCTQQR